MCDEKTFFWRRKHNNQQIKVKLSSFHIYSIVCYISNILLDVIISLEMAE